MSTKFVNGLQNAANYSVTENGGLGYATTHNAMVDFNFMVSSFRQKSEQEIKNEFENMVKASDPTYATRYLFFARDCREGLGERRLFRVCLPTLIENVDVSSLNLPELIMEYGRADDLFALFDTKFEGKMIEFVSQTLANDKAAVAEKKSCSLLAKWMPSINTTSMETRKLAKRFVKALGMDEKTYRKTLSMIRKYLDVIEVKTSSNDWSEINYSNVPSKANLKYKDAFLKHDETRRLQFLDSVKSGEAKINAAVLNPCDIVQKYGLGRWSSSKNLDDTLEVLWNNLKDTVNGQGNFMVVRDGSGSMTCGLQGTSMTPLDVATAMAIYFAERGNAAYKDKYITFSDRPKFVDLSGCKTLKDKLLKSYKEADCSNTNIELTMKLVLDTAVQNHLTQEEIPDLLIISDMEFDYCVGWGHSRNDRVFDAIAQDFAAKGYKLPRLIFWNVNSRTGTIPVIQNDLGVILLSGYSQNAVDMVLSGKLDPWEALKAKLDSERYANISLSN